MEHTVSYILPFAFVRARISTYKGTPAQQKMPQNFGWMEVGGATCSYRDGRCVHGDTLMATEEKKIFPNLEISAAILFFLTCVHYKKASF